MFLIVGLPAAGKTTRAKELAAERRALRLSPDAWMIPLYGEREAGGKRDVLEGRLIWLALEVLRLGTSVVLDFGFWARDERWALRWLARSAGLSCQVEYLPVDRDAQLARISHRWVIAPHQTFAMTEAEVDCWRDMFEVPCRLPARIGMGARTQPHAVRKGVVGTRVPTCLHVGTWHRSQSVVGCQVGAARVTAVRYADSDDRAVGYGSSYEGILCASLEHSVRQMPGAGRVCPERHSQTARVALYSAGFLRAVVDPAGSSSLAVRCVRFWD